jgi:hypothetical protein
MYMHMQLPEVAQCLSQPLISTAVTAINTTATVTVTATVCFLHNRMELVTVMRMTVQVPAYLRGSRPLTYCNGS